VRYSQALKRNEMQESIMQQVMQMPEIDEKWDSEEVEELILSRIK
jgi:kynurenine 3-monooxygenase